MSSSVLLGAAILPLFFSCVLRLKSPSAEQQICQSTLQLVAFNSPPPENSRTPFKSPCWVPAARPSAHSSVVITADICLSRYICPPWVPLHRHLCRWEDPGTEKAVRHSQRQTPDLPEDVVVACEVRGTQERKTNKISGGLTEGAPIKKGNHCKYLICCLVSSRFHHCPHGCSETRT